MESSLDLEWAFSALRGTMGMKCTQSMVKYVAMKGPCWLEVGTCQLPLQRLHHDHCKLLTFNTPWKEFRVEIKNKALCALGKTQKNWPSDSQMFSGKDFMSPNSCIFSHLEKHWHHEPMSGPGSPGSPWAAFLLLLIFGPCTFKFHVKFVSSRIQQISKW